MAFGGYSEPHVKQRNNGNCSYYFSKYNINLTCIPEHSRYARKRKKPRNFISDKANCLQKTTFNSWTERLLRANRTLWPQKFISQGSFLENNHRRDSALQHREKHYSSNDPKSKGKNQSNSAVFAVKFRGSHLSVTWHLSLPAWKSFRQFPVLLQSQSCSSRIK